MGSAYSKRDLFEGGCYICKSNHYGMCSIASCNFSFFQSYNTNVTFSIFYHLTSLLCTHVPWTLLSQTPHYLKLIIMLLRSFTIMVSRTIFHFPWELRQWGSVVKYIIQWCQTYYRGTGLVDLTSPSGLAQEFCNKDKFLFNLSINRSGSDRWFPFTCIYTVHVHVVEATKDYTLEWSYSLLDKQN